ncbi:MAG: hypothetical protein Q8O55_08790 [Dehalococcoidales bacterium]|nr:hypothetical protein [Dehalococcoidales bacterium]
MGNCNCGELPLKRMFEILEQSIVNRHEMGAVIRDDCNIGKTIEGEKGSIKGAKLGPLDANDFAFYHTHPGSYAYLSAGDILAQAEYDHPMECVGAINDERDGLVIRCFSAPEGKEWDDIVAREKAMAKSALAVGGENVILTPTFIKEWGKLLKEAEVLAVDATLLRKTCEFTKKFS